MDKKLLAVSFDKWNYQLDKYFSVAKAKNCKTGFNLLKKWDPDVIILKIKEDENWNGFITEVYNTLKICPVIAVSSTPSMEEALEVMKAGAAEYLSEPLNITAVAKTIAEKIGEPSVIQKIDFISTTNQLQRKLENTLFGHCEDKINSLEECIKQYNELNTKNFSGYFIESITIRKLFEYALSLNREKLRKKERSFSYTYLCKTCRKKTAEISIEPAGISKYFNGPQYGVLKIDQPFEKLELPVDLNFFLFLADLIISENSTILKTLCRHFAGINYCSECDCCYCQDHWKTEDIENQNSYQVKGTCPEGHNKTIYESII